MNEKNKIARTLLLSNAGSNPSALQREQDNQQKDGYKEMKSKNILWREYVIKIQSKETLYEWIDAFCVCVSPFISFVCLLSQRMDLWIDAAKIDNVIHLATDGAAGAAL